MLLAEFWLRHRNESSRVFGDVYKCTHDEEGVKKRLYVWCAIIPREGERFHVISEIDLKDVLSQQIYMQRLLLNVKFES